MKRPMPKTKRPPIYDRIRQILEAAQTSVVRNVAMILAALGGCALLWALTWRS